MTAKRDVILVTTKRSVVHFTYNSCLAGFSCIFYTIERVSVHLSFSGATERLLATARPCDACEFRSVNLVPQP